MNFTNELRELILMSQAHSEHARLRDFLESHADALLELVEAAKYTASKCPNCGGTGSVQNSSFGLDQCLLCGPLHAALAKLEDGHDRR